MAKIQHINAREILNSKGNPTIETTVVLDNGIEATASAPAGTSVSTYEAFELKDHDPHRYDGKGMLRAIQHVQSTIAPRLKDMDPAKQEEIDNVLLELDGTQNKSHLGGNTILSVSAAVAKSGAAALSKSLFQHIHDTFDTRPLSIPVPLFNIINGGKHAVDTFDFQEFIVIPATAPSFHEALETGVSIYSALQEILHLNNLSTLVGFEGGFAPKLLTNKEAFALMKEAAESTEKKLGTDILLGMDVASSPFYRNHQYHIKDISHPLTSEELINFYAELAEDFPILYMEDILAEDDWDGWRLAVEKLGTKHLVTGDDLISTNPHRLTMAIDKRAVTATIIKPNQIGTVSETVAVVKKAQDAGLKIIVSHRSGDTNDDFIADFAVGIGADYIKCGAPSRGERVAKYNRLLAIEDLLKQ